MVDTTRRKVLGVGIGAVLAGGTGLRMPDSLAAPDQDLSRVNAGSGARRTVIKDVSVLVMDDQRTELFGTDVLVVDDKIAQIGKALSVDDAQVIAADGMILMPGMVDGHLHVWQAVQHGSVMWISKTLRGYHPWKYRTMVCYEPQDAYLSEYLGGLQAIDAGVTSVLDYCHAFHTPELALAGARGLKDSGVAGTFCYQVSHTPDYGPGDKVSLEHVEALRRAPADDQHWQIAKLLRDEVFTDNESVLKFGLCPSSQGRRLVGELVQEVRRIRTYEPHLISSHFGVRHDIVNPDIWHNFTQLQTTDVPGPDLHLAHGNGMTDEELRLAADTGTKITATNRIESILREEPSVHGRARELGVEVGIGDDNPNIHTTDYFETVRISYVNLGKTPHGRELCRSYTGYDALDYATRLGARSIRDGDVAGTIGVGRRADLVLLRTDRFDFPNVGTLADRVANFACAADIDSVWVAGVLRKHTGQMLGVDMAKLKVQAAQARERIQRKAATIDIM